MLGANDKKVLLDIISQMAEIINAIPGEIFVNKEIDILMIMQRKLADCDLKRQLGQYNEIFARQAGAGIPDITNSMIAYVRIKVLLESGIDTFDGKAYRELYKECKSQIARTNNIIRLMKASAMIAEEYQKDRIEMTLRKNDAFITCLECEMDSVEMKLERMPKTEAEVQIPVMKEPVPEKTDAKKLERKGEFFGRFKKIRHSRKENMEIKEHLRNEEKKQAMTQCEEIPYYETCLSFTVSLVCKDIPVYSLMKRKNHIYFGMSKNVGKSTYDNSDGTLVELTRASEEFLQFMAEDLLNGEFVLNPFSNEEKEAMQMYFDFISKCFEQHIGVTLTVQEYLKFKVYYNRLVSRMMELERQQKEDYYKALILADRYQSYMKSYDLECADTRNEIIRQIIKKRSSSYIGDITLILNNHIADMGAKEELEQLIDDMDYFHKEKEAKDTTAEVITAEAKESEEVFPHVIANGVTQNIMQIVIQLLDEKNEVVDEALYSGDNIKQALYDYARKEACIKRLRFRNNGTDIFCKEEVSK